MYAREPHWFRLRRARSIPEFHTLHFRILQDPRPASRHCRILQGPVFCQRYAASTPQCQSLLVLVRASFLSSSCTMTRPRADSTTTLHLSLSLSSLSPALPPGRASFESVHCDMRLICIVNTYPVECAELSYNCLLEMASWLFPCFSRTHTDTHTHTHTH